MRSTAVIFLVLWSISCGKKTEDPQPTLPPATAEGKNTMGCYVNGVLHIYSGVSSYMIPTGVSYLSGANHTEVRGWDKQQPGDIFLVIDGSNIQIGVKYNKLFTHLNHTQYNQNGKSHYVQPHDTFNFVLFTRYDESVIAGEFQYKTKDENDIVNFTVTNGRFDIAR